MRSCLPLSSIENAPKRRKRRMGTPSRRPSLNARPFWSSGAVWYLRRYGPATGRTWGLASVASGAAGSRRDRKREDRMAKTAEGLKTRLVPEDEFSHDPGEAKNYNESMYFNVFDPAKKTGGWFRIGNRPNENYAEISVCIYLPDGRIAFTFGRPTIEGNKEMAAGGLRVEVVEPFKRLKVSYSGKALLLERPHEMADPKRAYRENPSVPCTVELDYEGVSPMYGGEAVKADGASSEVDPEKSFAKAHYEQHCAASGVVTVGDERFEISGYGLRDKSWGPRHWQ